MCQGMDAEVFAQSLCPQVFLLCLIAASLCKVLSSSAQITKVGVEGFSNVFRQRAGDPKQNQSENVKNKGDQSKPGIADAQAQEQYLS